MKKNLTYSDKLKDPRWQKKRLEIFDRDNFCCQKCYSEDKTLHVHHRMYKSGAEPWEYSDDLLVTLCHKCHEEESGLEDAVYDLILTIRKKFFANDIRELTAAFDAVETSYCSKVLSEAICYKFSRKEEVEQMEDEYIKWQNEVASNNSIFGQ